MSGTAHSQVGEIAGVFCGCAPVVSFLPRPPTLCSRSSLFVFVFLFFDGAYSTWQNPVSPCARVRFLQCVAPGKGYRLHMNLPDQDGSLLDPFASAEFEVARTCCSVSFFLFFLRGKPPDSLVRWFNFGSDLLASLATHTPTRVPPPPSRACADARARRRYSLTPP